METILVLAHTENDGSLAKSAREALHAAATLHKSLAGSKLVVGLIGENVQAAANSIAACPATKYLGVTGAEFQPVALRHGRGGGGSDLQSGAGNDCYRPGDFALGAGYTGRRATARRTRGHACHRSRRRRTGKFPSAAGITGSAWKACSMRTQRPWFIGIDPGSQAACDCGAGTAAVEMVAVNLTDASKRTTVVGMREPKADAQTIRPDAQLLFVTGAGWTKKQADGQTHLPEAEKLILDFLKKSRASLGSSKSLVDLGGEGQAVLPFCRT